MRSSWACSLFFSKLFSLSVASERVVSNVALVVASSASAKAKESKEATLTYHSFFVVLLGK
jgi:hypothetical protein